MAVNCRSRKWAEHCNSRQCGLKVSDAREFGNKLQSPPIHLKSSPDSQARIVWCLRDNSVRNAVAFTHGQGKALSWQNTRLVMKSSQYLRLPWLPAACQKRITISNRTHFLDTSVFQNIWEGSILRSGNFWTVCQLMFSCDPYNTLHKIQSTFILNRRNRYKTLNKNQSNWSWKHMTTSKSSSTCDRASAVSGDGVSSSIHSLQTFHFLKPWCVLTSLLISEAIPRLSYKKRNLCDEM